MVPQVLAGVVTAPRVLVCIEVNVMVLLARLLPRPPVVPRSRVVAVVPAPPRSAVVVSRIAGIVLQSAVVTRIAIVSVLVPLAVATAPALIVVKAHVWSGVLAPYILVVLVVFVSLAAHHAVSHVVARAAAAGTADLVHLLALVIAGTVGLGDHNIGVRQSPLPLLALLALAWLQECIQVVFDFKAQLNIFALALQVATLAALHAPHEGLLLLAVASTFGLLPDLEASLTGVPDQAAGAASLHVFIGALGGFVADFVALEAKFLGALVGIVRVFAAQDATEGFPLVGALSSLVAELLAVAALDRRVRLDVVARLLTFEFAEIVFLFRLRLHGLLGVFALFGICLAEVLVPL